jgi:hypothetical protein
MLYGGKSVGGEEKSCESITWSREENKEVANNRVK